MKISDIFEINDHLKDCKLLSGKKGLSNEVSSVAIMEVPDGAFWVKENQLIVTMGYSLKKGDITMTSLIQMLIDRKAAGLGIKLGRFIDKISQEDLDYAESHDFPIFSIPISLEYDSIIDPIEIRLMESTYCDFNYLRKIRKDFSNLLMRRCDERVIVGFLEEHLNKNVYIVKYKNSVPYVGLDETKESKNIIHEINLKKESILSGDESATLKCDNFDLYIKKINMDGNVEVLLCVELEPDEQLSVTKKELINEVLPPLYVMLFSDMEMMFRGQKTKTEFLSDVMVGRYVSQPFKLVEDAALLNVDILKSRFCLAIYVNDVESSNMYMNSLEKIALGKKLKAYFTCAGNKIAAVIETDRKCTNAKYIMEYLEYIYEKLSEVNSDNEVRIAVSNVCNNLKYMNYAYEEAYFALSMGEKINPGKNILLYEDYMIFKLLNECSANFTTKKMYENTITALKNADEAGNQSYLKTVEALCENGFSIREASEQLFIHRNTLYKRIEKINDILGFDINTNDNRLLISLMTKLNKML